MLYWLLFSVFAWTLARLLTVYFDVEVESVTYLQFVRRFGFVFAPGLLLIVALLAAQGADDRVAYGYVQKELALTGGNLTIHLRKLEDASYVAITKDFIDAKPRTWIQTTETGRNAYARYVHNLRQTLNLQPPNPAAPTPKKTQTRTSHAST